MGKHNLVIASSVIWKLINKILIFFIILFSCGGNNFGNQDLIGEWQGLIDNKIYTEVFIENNKLLQLRYDAGIGPFAYYLNKNDTLFFSQNQNVIEHKTYFWKIIKSNKDSLIFYSNDGYEIKLNRSDLEPNFQINNYDYDILFDNFQDRYFLYTK